MKLHTLTGLSIGTKLCGFLANVPPLRVDLSLAEAWLDEPSHLSNSNSQVFQRLGADVAHIEWVLTFLGAPMRILILRATTLSWWKASARFAAMCGHRPEGPLPYMAVGSPLQERWV